MDLFQMFAVAAAGCIGYLLGGLLALSDRDRRDAEWIARIDADLRRDGTEWVHWAWAKAALERHVGVR